MKANVVVARQVAKRYGDQGILSVSVNPGVLRTDLQRYIPNWQRPFMVRSSFLYFSVPPRYSRQHCSLVRSSAPRLERCFDAALRWHYA